MERKVLGKGLSALIPESTEKRENVVMLSVSKITRSSFQPREHFTESRLKELAESIREKGVIQPVLVRPSGEQFELIAGERRFRAVQLLGATEIPAIVRQVDNEGLLELSLVENIQREELNAVEEAKAYKRLNDEFQLTHEQIASKVGKDRVSITNTVRLLNLPEKVLQRLSENFITMGHARALLSLENPRRQIQYCERIIKRHLSVRQAEGIIKRVTTSPAKPRQETRDIHLADVEQFLQHRFGTRVKIMPGKKRGKIQIDYYSKEDLTRIVDLLMGNSKAS